MKSAPKGARAYNDAPYQRGSNLTLIGAMALRGLVGEMTLPRATDALAFKTYVKQVLVPNKKAVVPVWLWITCRPTKLLVSALQLKR